MGGKQYIIQFGGLSVGSHLFEMDITDKFFEGLDHAEVTKGNVKAEIELVKQNHVITLNFHLHGTVETACDRCAKEAPLPVDISDKVVVKNGNPEESTDEIVVLPHGETEIDVSHFLYEFITLAIPVKRVPCEENEDIECDEEALKNLGEIETDEEKNDAPEELNPIWEKLKNIKISEN
jgi:uncharacterized protein